MRLLMLLVDDLDPGAAELDRIRIGIEGMAPFPIRVEVEPIRLGLGHYYESSVGLAMAVPGVLDQVLRHQGDADAILLGCFGDPGLRAAREVSRVPVIGAGEASMILANFYGNGFGVVHIRSSNIPECDNQLATLGLSHKCVGMGAIEMSFDAVLDDEAQTFDLLQAECRRLIAAGAEVIILGCLSLGLGPFSDQLASSLGVPVINPLRAALATAGVYQAVGSPPLGPSDDLSHLAGYLPLLERSATAAGLRGYRSAGTPDTGAGCGDVPQHDQGVLS